MLALTLPLRAQALHDTSPLVDQNVATLEVGQRVRVRGLTKHIQLNSKYGVIATAPKKDGGRYGVLIEFITDAPDLGPGGKSLVVTQDPLAIKRENLEIAPPRLPHSVLCASTYGRLDQTIDWTRIWFRDSVDMHNSCYVAQADTLSRTPYQARARYVPYGTELR